MAVDIARIERELERQAGVHAALLERDNELVISGLVDTDREREAALDIVASLVPNKVIVDDLEVVAVLPEQIGDLSLSEAALGDFGAATPDTSDESLEPGDFTDQDILKNPAGASGPGYTAVDEELSEGDEAYVPPTDPVRDSENEVLGGFALSSTDSVKVPHSALDGKPGDEAIAETLLRELREDAATNGLDIDVTVSQGVVRLRGRVQSMDDAENAEEVAFRIEGVVDVYDELKIADLE
jgi:osmotically-inducible protein OsmY